MLKNSTLQKQQQKPHTPHTDSSGFTTDDYYKIKRKKFVDWLLLT